MDIKTAVDKAGGYSAVATAHNIDLQPGDRALTKQAVYGWVTKGRLPATEWTGETQYALTICQQIKAMNNEHVHPLDLCPGSGQYMEQPRENAA